MVAIHDESQGSGRGRVVVVDLLFFFSLEKAKGITLSPA